jgi:CheY-like chemotaxis protein
MSSAGTIRAGVGAVPSSQPMDSTVGKPATSPECASILVVEDHADLRRMLATALRMDGHDVDEAGDAHEGLARLGSHRYDLVLTDYAMPGETGTWMLHEATRLGLMHDAVALVVTAQPGVREISEVEVITKPLDLDNFLEPFRSFVIGVALILREHGRSALITQTVASSQMSDHTAPFLSTIADAILTLD